MSTRPAAELAELRAWIQHLETEGRRFSGVLPFGVPSLDAALPRAAWPLGALHEVAGGGDGAVDGAAAALFAAGSPPGCQVRFCEASPSRTSSPRPFDRPALTQGGRSISRPETRPACWPVSRRDCGTGVSPPWSPKRPGCR